MVSYTRARAEGLGISLNGGAMQRAERVLLIALGSLVAAWFSSAAIEIIGVVMAICGVSCTATAVTRWLAAYRELAKGDAAIKPLPKVRTMPEIVVVPVSSPLRESAELRL
jgi:hypothetical protein